MDDDGLLEAVASLLSEAESKFNQHCLVPELSEGNVTPREIFPLDLKILPFDMSREKNEIGR